jgi:predicted cation transporter
MLELSLVTIILLVLFLPIFIRSIENNLEIFLFFMGILTVMCSHLWGPEPVWSLHLVKESLLVPVMITLAVIIVGFILHFFRKKITKFIIKVERALGSKLFCFVLIIALGSLSSVITAIMAAIVLVEVVSALKLNREYELKLVVLGCFAIGLGAVLTPIGEPLSTIAIAKLKGAPHNADFFFLSRILGKFVLPGILFLGVLGAIIEPSVKEVSAKNSFAEKEESTIKDIFIYGGKVYIFIMALVYLGAGFKPIIDIYIIKLPSPLLYWINILSAILDNATLTAAEISPQMALSQIQYILMGLLISGGMLIPGNIPNIISAGRLKIKSKEWAKIGMPVGFVLMVIYFIVFSFLG